MSPTDLTSGNISFDLEKSTNLKPFSIESNEGSVRLKVHTKSDSLVLKGLLKNFTTPYILTVVLAFKSANLVYSVAVGSKSIK